MVYNVNTPQFTDCDYVTTYRTYQHPCNGTMHSDGSIIRIDSTRTIATGPGVCVPKEE